MKKAYTKLLLTLAALVTSAVMVVSVSYAWLVLSNNPVAEGIQITIGGGNTILVAADQTREANGKIYHYPGSFDGTLNFTQDAGYAYLGELSALTPVSTADGVNWFIPTYYDLTDLEVQNGTILSGTLKPWVEFERDNTLRHANLSKDDADKASEGSYIYLDFWVVSPGSDYTLRVSTGEDSGGSYVIGLPQAEATEDGWYRLVSGDNSAEACVRVGLLANPNYVTDETMWYYQNSPGYSDTYTRLRGDYQDPGAGAVDTSGYRFTIYEPNADFHPSIPTEEGNYLLTQPIGLAGGIATPVDVDASLTVQTKNFWLDAPVGEGTQLEQRFQAAVLEPSFQGLSANELTRKFYDEYLSALVDPYVGKGVFVKNTKNLYNALNSRGVADGEFLSRGYTANATDDVYIVQLEKNVPQRIRMFVWLEGQDADCVNSAEASSFAFRIELAGSHETVETQSDTAQVPMQDIVLPQVQQDELEPREEETEADAPVENTQEDSGAGDESQSETVNETEVEHEKQNE